MQLLQIRDLNVTYLTGGKRVRAVENISLSMNSGESLGVVGESGSGKSTLAMAVLRMLPERNVEISGTVELLGTDLFRCTPETLRGLRWKKMSVVFQKAMNSLSPVHRIGRQLADIYRLHEPAATRQEVETRILELFGLVNLPPRVMDMYPHELSGGMVQRVSIATSLLHKPPLLILDEATTALDVVTQAQILKELKELEQKIDVTWLLITHDISIVATACKKVAVIYAGMLMEYGDVRKVMTAPAHPYTQALLRSFPSLHGNLTQLHGIPGTIPDLSQKNPGCVFAPRCARAQKICFQQRPPETGSVDGHRFSCFFAEVKDHERG